MKFNELNQNQKTVYRLVVETIDEYLGGFENQLMDSAEGSFNYNQAKAALELPHNEMVKEIASWVKTRCQWQHCEHLHFVGLDFLHNTISKRLIKEGY